MSRTASARARSQVRSPGRTRWPTAVGLVVVIAGIVGTLVYQSASSATPTVAEVPPGTPRAPAVAGPTAAAPDAPVDAADDGTVTEADGVLPDGVTVFDDEYPGVANLDPDLLLALRAATTEAGIVFVVNSGWRTPDYQNQLRREAVAEYGSAAEAARWVATPDTSAHVSGDAVDIGPADAAAWLSEHGAEYGLCQIYRNEPWHYELRPEAVGNRCPRMYADPTHDPRMQQ